MRVLFITNCPAPYRVKFFNELSKYCKLTVAFEMKNAQNRDKDWKSEESYRFRTIFLKSEFQKQEGAFCPEIKKYIREFRNDVIVVGGYSTPTGMYSIFYMRIHRIPFVLNCDGGFIKNDIVIRKWIKQFFIRSASAWLSTGKMCTKYLVHYGADERMVYEYPFTSIKAHDIIDTASTQKALIRQRLGIKETNVVLYMGRFIAGKGIDVLVKACWNLKDVALVLVGGNDISEFWPKYNTKSQMHVYVEGFKTEKELKQYYQVADMLVLPTRADVWGLVINEAMAFGVPVITTDRCGAGLELIAEGKNGYIVPVNDVELLKKRICCILENKTLQHDMGANSKKIIEKYTIESMAQTHEEIFERYIKNINC